MRSIRIPLHSRKYPGLHAIVDEHDAELVNQYRWYPVRRSRGFYAITRAKGATLYMHRVILATPPGLDTDHINGDGLDNRRFNLRACTRRENTANRRKPRSNTTGYVGVERTREGKYRAGLFVNYKRVEIGTFFTAEEAARARDDAAREAFGEFARLNFPNPGERGV